MDLQLTSEIISSYKRLSYQVWYALAEFVDNSTQAYFNNKAILDKTYKASQTKLTVEIEYKTDKHGLFIRISDNSIGMSENELERAVIIGQPPQNKSGRSKYGLGLKTGASWFGDEWTVTTKKLGETQKHKITVNVPTVAGGNLHLPEKHWKAPSGDHSTVVEIRKLHRPIAGRTIGKVKDYLRSIYRVDISNGTLVLKWNEDVLSWDSNIDAKLVTAKDGSKWKRNFSFRVAGKHVSGWAGVLEKGSRRSAGFHANENYY